MSVVDVVVWKWEVAFRGALVRSGKAKMESEARQTWIDFSACITFYSLISRYVENISPNRAKVRRHKILSWQWEVGCSLFAVSYWLLVVGCVVIGTVTPVNFLVTYSTSRFSRPFNALISILMLL